MSKASEQLAARAARAASKRGGEVQEQPDTSTLRPRSTKPRTDTVRITVDLAPLLYRRLGDWCANAAEDMGVARVSAAKVIRALILKVDEDPELAQAIRDRLRADVEK